MDDVATTQTNDAGPLAGRRALVTGAGSGVGKATAHALSAQGAAIAVLDIREDAISDTVDELLASGTRAVGYRCDVTDEASVADAVSNAVEELGGLEVVVTAAGITKPAHTHELGLDEWQQILAVNLTGTFLTLKHTLPRLVAAERASIVTIGSIASLVSAGRSSAYDASKGGVLQLTRSIAIEYSDRDVRANCVCPGAVTTPMAKNSRELYGWRDGLVAPIAGRVRPAMERSADPAEIADVVAFLASDRASFMTGTAVPVDGGYTAI